MSCRTTSGGSVATSLARTVTGLEDREIQELFHALKREGASLNQPSELELEEWRKRQMMLLERMGRMKENRKDALRQKLFRSRSEPVPDGSMFYAWSRVEARARQEVAIRSISDVIDLEPPGSQADQYELGEDGRPTKVWYASYGSNLSEARFMAYIEGGQPPGSQRTYAGCDDKTPPEDNIPIRYPGARPHFALTSAVWRGGIAFIDAQKGETATGLGRAYAVSITQFDQVVAQENGMEPAQAAPVPLDEALTLGRSVTGPGSYQTILHIGDYKGAPVLTFTAPFSTRDAMLRRGHLVRNNVRLPVMTNKPSGAYVRMIGSGLKETFGMDEVAQADYIRGCPGGDRWSRNDLVRVLRGEDLPAVSGPSGGDQAANAASTTGTPKAPKMPVFSEQQRRALAASLAAGRGDAGRPAVLESAPSGRRRRKTRPDDEPRAGRRRAAAAEEPQPTGRGRGRSSGQDRFYSKVKQYATIDEQREGVRRWRTIYEEARQKAAEMKVEYEPVRLSCREMVDSGVPTTDPEKWKAADKQFAKLHRAMAQANARELEASFKYRSAKSQTPSDYYGPAESQTASEWRRIATEGTNSAVLAHTTFEEANARLTQLRANNAMPERVTDQEKKVDRLRRGLAEFEDRLEEIEAKADKAARSDD